MGGVFSNYLSIFSLFLYFDQIYFPRNVFNRNLLKKKQAKRDICSHSLEAFGRKIFLVVIYNDLQFSAIVLSSA